VEGRIQELKYAHSRPRPSLPVERPFSSSRSARTQWAPPSPPWLHALRMPGTTPPAVLGTHHPLLSRERVPSRAPTAGIMRIQHHLRQMDRLDLHTREDPPLREVPNYAGRLKWAIWSLTTASAIFLGLRLYCKLSRHRSLWWDDGFLILSWVCHHSMATTTPCPRLRPDTG